MSAATMILRVANLLFHIVALASGVYYSYWVFTNMHPQVWSGHGAFLTQWSHVLENILLFILILDDLRAIFGIKGSAFWRRFIDAYFSILFTLTTMVGVMFWGLYFWNKDMILPPAAQKIYPADVNIYQHGMVAVWMWMELILRRHGNIEPAKFDIALTPGLGLLYLAWSTLVWHMSDQKWPYPFQRKLPNTVIIPLYVGALLLSTAFAYFKRVMVRVAERWIHSWMDPQGLYGQFNGGHSAKVTLTKASPKKKAKAM